MIEICDLYKSYEQGGRKISVLKKLNFQAQKGKSYAIIGESGSGKSTLLNLLTGLDEADAGSITIDGLNLTTMTPHQKAELRKAYLAIIFQEFYLMEHLSALENVRLALDIKRGTSSSSQKEHEQASAQALEEVKLEQRLHHLPAKLSGGEKQRVAIARAFVTQPEILIADEPSGNLDPKTGDDVMTVLWEMVQRHHTTLILITHNHRLAAHCDHTFVLESGALKPYQH